MDRESVLDFNFWPSFADLMLAFVFILVLVLFIFTGFLALGTEDLTPVKRSQRNIITEVAEGYHTRAIDLGDGRFGISTTKDTTSCDIHIRNGTTVQQITFSDHILFPQDEYTLSDRGRQALGIVGTVLKEQLSLIKEIQILGHADTDPTEKHQSNMHLAANRAIEVFTFLQESVGVDPSQNLISVTSYGEYKPVDRTEADTTYCWQRLLDDNSNPELKNRNRRIELLLRYRF